MSSMWNSEEFGKNLVVSAKSIVEQQCAELSRITEKKVIGVLRTYDGRYKSESYLKNGTYAVLPDSTLKAISSQFAGKSMEKFNVQDVLGNQGDSGKFVYEFYLTAKATPHYKYRVFLLYFDARLYPVGLSIDQSIADEINCKTEIQVSNEADFKELLADILASSVVTNIVKNLLSF